MRLAGLVLCFIAAPALGAPMDLEFTVMSGTLSLDTSPDGLAVPDPVTVGLMGTFAMTVDASDGHIGSTDTFVLGDAHLTNPDSIILTLASIATATILPGSAVFTGFLNPLEPGHVPGGIYQTDATLNAWIFVTGAFTTTFNTNTNAGELLPFTIDIDPVSAGLSDIIMVSLYGVFGYEVGVSAIGQTITLDLIIDVVATAHVVPDPALGGLTAMGLGGAGAWLRRRR